MIIKIKLIHSNGLIQEESFYKKKVEVGRYTDNDLVIENETISGKHCEIIQDEGKLKVIDLGSRNGVIYKRELVTSINLGESGSIILGDCTLEIEIDNQDKTREIDLAEFIDSRQKRNVFNLYLAGAYLLLTVLKFWAGNYNTSQLKVFNELFIELVGFIIMAIMLTVVSKIISRKMNILPITKLLLRAMVYLSLLAFLVDFLISIHPWMGFVKIIFYVFVVHLITAYILLINSHYNYRKIFGIISCIALVAFGSIKFVEKINDRADLYTKYFSFDDHLSLFVPYVGLKDSNLEELNKGFIEASSEVEKFRREFLEKKQDQL